MTVAAARRAWMWIVMMRTQVIHLMLLCERLFENASHNFQFERFSRILCPRPDCLLSIMARHCEQGATRHPHLPHLHRTPLPLWVTRGLSQRWTRPICKE